MSKIVEVIANKTGLPKKAVRDVLEAIADELKKLPDEPFKLTDLKVVSGDTFRYEVAEQNVNPHGIGADPLIFNVRIESA